jgi:hypothetical protein
MEILVNYQLFFQHILLYRYINRRVAVAEIIRIFSKLIPDFRLRLDFKTNVN